MSKKRQLEEQKQKEQTEERVLSLYAEGQTIEDIASALSIAPQSVVDTLENKKEFAQTRRSLKLEKVLKEKRLTSEARAEAIGSLLNKMFEEIQRRDLSDIPTDKLLSLYIKAQTDLTKQVEQVTIYSEKVAREEEEKRVSPPSGWLF